MFTVCRYLAPEYARRRRASDKADAFSYGVVLLELITGRNPLNKIDSSTNGFLISWVNAVNSC